MKIRFKLDLKMKLTMYLFIFSLFQIHANTYSQNAKITLQLKDVTIEKVLQEIEVQTEFKVLYNHNDYDYTTLVSVNAKNTLVTKVLDLIFSNTKIKYKTVEKQIVLLQENTKKVVASPQAKKQQLKIITGTVTDSEGEPLPGASIVEKGTSNGTVTDFDGNFSMKRTKENIVLLVSYVGYKTKEVALSSDETSIAIQLEEDTASLEEVVLVGYGSQVKSKITGSIATIKSEDLTVAPTTNTTAALAGRLPGLVVTQNNGQPGGDQANISIRGFGNALVIVDGVPRDYQQLDPNEIESISILKDASAAVYGARAGNGVILVTTKRGKIGEPKINYSGSYTIQQPTFMPKAADAASYAKYQLQAEKLEGVAEADWTFSEDDIAKYRAGTEEGYRGTDWQDVVFKDWSTTKQNNLNVQGGTERVKYFTSVGHLKQSSILESEDGEFERYNIGATVDVKINDRLNIGANLKYREEKNERPSGRDGDEDGYFRAFEHALSMNPTVQQNPDGTLTSAHPLETNAIAYSTSDITGINNTKRKQFDAILNFDYQIPYVEGLQLSGKISHQTVGSVNNLTRMPFVTYNYDYDTNTSSPSFTSSEDHVQVETVNASQTTTQIGFDYEKKLDDHTVSGKLLLENRYIDSYTFFGSKTQLLSSDAPYLYGAIGTPDNGDIITENGRTGIIGRMNYDYQGKYLVEALFRADANIQFPEESRWGYFPGVSLGWVLSKEAFLENISAVNYLKLRTSYASLGFDNTSSFDYLSGYDLQNDREYQYVYQTNLNTTLQTIGLANPNITWETMKTFNVGVDANLWNSMLGVEFDVFYRKRSGLLRNRIDQFPDTFGADLPQENLGVRDNRGFELVLTHKNHIGDFNYSLSGNVTWTREKIIENVEREFDPENPDDARINQTNGQWTNRRFGYRTDGFYDSQEEIDTDGIDYDPAIGEPVLGDVKYVDRNEDGVIDWKDQEVIGRNETPELFYGFTMNADYKGFDFSMLWQGAGRFDVMMSGAELAANTSIGQMPLQYQADYAWSADNPSAAKLPAPNTRGLNEHNRQTLDIYQKDGTYLRLKTIALGYTIPKTLTEKLKIKRARVYVSGYNLFTIQNTGIFEVDPELRGNGVTAYPIQKNISLGVNIGL